MKDESEIIIGKLLPEPWARSCGRPGSGLTDLDRQCARWMGARTTELKVSHLSVLSISREVVDVIIEAVNATAAG
jgi:hypothetical protein